MNAEGLKNIYFIGIGGIGMSALARYFKQLGKNVAGYDRTETELTRTLVREGIAVHYTDDINLVDAAVLANPSQSAVVYTPAVPKDHKELNYLRDKGYTLYKRAEILGLITRETYTIAVGGTHGKTTTSCMVAHLLRHANIGCGAFLGGISANFNSNFVLPDANAPEAITVTEADEFDRSFLHLSPNIAVITSMDADHLDIYGEHSSLLESFHLFAHKIKAGGTLFVRFGQPFNTQLEDATVLTYGLGDGADYYAANITINNGHYYFDLVTPTNAYTNLKLGMPGIHNVENAVAASSIALKMGVTEEQLRSGLAAFKGVKRRFEYIINREDFVYIDDYAHHPTELEAAIKSARQLYPGKKIMGVFQPHLYSRTRDFVDGFAHSLSLLDEVILLDIYPARELPIDGVTSEIIFDKITTAAKTLCTKDEFLAVIKNKQPEVLLTLGAGDIDQFVLPLQHLYTA
ncbi:MAG: UDP-N-acetylmuramate--L-alanine ligase [Bacteroidetes bacterium]|nr:MAG: UDP-N-acetylmuramate--L-alanine ligase [Bacteroidota bacterium]